MNNETMSTDITFSIVLNLFRNYPEHNFRFQRRGWNGEGMYITMETSVDLVHFETEEENGEEVLRFDPCHSLEKIILLKTSSGAFVPWCPSQTDILADDWIQLDVIPEDMVKSKIKPHKFLEDTPDNGTVILPRNLLEDIMLELSACHGVYCTDHEDIIEEMDDDVWFKLDESEIISRIKKFI